MRQKLSRFNDIAHHPNILEPGKDLFDQIKGNWKKEFFENEKELVLELGCGRGEYTISMARLNPTKNFIGVDVKGDRIWVGSTIALEEGLQNVAFLRTQIQVLDNFFEENEVSEIWITFPDPRPKGRDERRRLTSPRFLKIYERILKPAGVVHLKTDNTEFFEYTLEALKSIKTDDLQVTYDLYESNLKDLHQGVKTNYEKIYTEKGEIIKYLNFKINK
ncbi:tRNA (guanosine(46)-N7)-methyltransferase TrmB [soil metagenome]